MTLTCSPNTGIINLCLPLVLKQSIIWRFNISALTSGIISKYDFLNSKDGFSEKGLIGKATIQWKDLKTQTDIAQKRYRKLHSTYEFDGIIIIKETIKKYNISNLIYNNRNTVFTNIITLTLIVFFLHQNIKF